MDRSFNSPLLLGKSPFSPRCRQNVSSRRLNTSIASPAFRKSSHLSVSGKSAQSIQIVLKSPYNSVERFGQPLPVLITEALTFADRNVVVSARISECGYAWVVCGRKLLIWQYRQTHQMSTPQKRLNSQCFELQLPQSDLAHRAELVSLFVSGASHSPSCIAVSPEGMVRFWPSVRHESVSVEQLIDLQGQECDSLTNIGEVGCILATTTCSVVLVQPYVSAGRHFLKCHTLRAPTGWLSGISKKMSSFIFGPMSSEQGAETRLVRVLSVQESEQSWVVYVLAGHSLQKWKMSLSEPEKLIFVAELNRLVCDGFHSTVWENCGGDQTETDTWLLDIQSDKDNIIILVAAVNMHVSPQVHYALISVQTNTMHPPNHIRDFLVLKMSGLYREDNSVDSLSYRFLLCGTCAYLYNQRSIIVIRPQEEPDTLEFTGSQDLLLGGSICVNTPIFFSRNHGLVSVSSNDVFGELSASVISSGTPFETSFNESAIGNLSVYNMDADEIVNIYKDSVNQLKAAFIFHIKNQKSACRDIIHELFLSDGQPVFSINAPMDKVVVQICQELVDDVPAGDPRWSHDTQVGVGSSYTMQVLNQLQDKQKALKLFIQFLHETELWNRLSAITFRDNVLSSVSIISECSEKLVATIALKQFGNKEILEKAINRVIKDTELIMDSGLTKQDIFFRQVSEVYRVFQEMVNYCEEMVHSDINPLETANVIRETNDILLPPLKDVIRHRQQECDNFIPHPNASSLAPDYLPWTSARGPEGLSDTLMLQQRLTSNNGARVVPDNLSRSILYDQLVGLTDIILDGFKSHLDSIKGTNRESILIKQYQVDRHKFINSLVVDKQWDRAAALAEKYLDFESLIVICESLNNQEKLNEYMERFSAEGFPEYVCSWYLQENQSGKLINRCRTMMQNRNTQRMKSFLDNHPHLSWIQNIFDGRFSNAADTLKDLALQENELVTRQKTMYSLSKLAKLAALDSEDRENYVDYIDSRLELITFQEDLPDYVLQHYGYDVNAPKVIPPKELINLHICNEYKEATEIEFKKALDILEYINEDELKNELALNIWRAAILRDSWLTGNLDSPIESLQNTLFIKLAHLAICLGADPQNLLPPLDALIDSPELLKLVEDKNFGYLLKTAYEYVQASNQ